MKSALLLFLGFSTQVLGAGLNSYADLIARDSVTTPRDGVRMTYLGTNGYQFEFDGHALLVDPYFSRVDLLSVALGSRLQPDMPRVAEGMRHLAPKAEAIVGSIGSPQRLEFTAIGNTVNIASRIQGLTKATGRPLLVTAAVRDRSGDSFNFEELPPQEVRGIEGRLSIFAVC